jgi:tetrahydromethanopterin S-methyltransferase subunit G
MPSDVTREEFQHLSTRTDILEREVEGEKMVTRHILEQTRRNGDDIAAVKTRLDRVETRLDKVENRLGGVENRLEAVEGRLGRVEHKVDTFSRDLPTIVGGAVRDAFREEREPKR